MGVPIVEHRAAGVRLRIFQYKMIEFPARNRGELYGFVQRVLIAQECRYAASSSLFRIMLCWKRNPVSGSFLD